MPHDFTGFFIGVAVAWATQWLQTFFKRSQYRHEKLMDRYADFVASAVTDLDRAKSQASGMVLGRVDQDYTELASQLDNKRHSNRLDLLRLSLQIRLLESDITLAQNVEQLANNQPFMSFPFPPHWHKGNYNERFDEFQNAILMFENQLQELTAAVFARHCSQSFEIKD